MIREARAADIRDIVEIHSTTLPRDFLPRLGNHFLRNVFYPGVIDSRHGFVIVHEELGRIYSFIVFAYDSRELTREATGHKLVLAAYVFAALLRDITLFGELISHLRGFRTEMRTDMDSCLDEVPELFVMATAPKYQSQGLGGKLLDRGLEILSKAHTGCLVKTSSPEANEFYKKHRFQDIGVEYRGKRRVRLLLRG